MWALELGRDSAADVAARAFDQGLLINAPRPATLRFMPALNIGEREVDRMIDILDAILRDSG